MKKIVIIGPAYPYRGGPSTFVSYLYEVLKKSFEVKIFNYKLLYPSFLFPGTTQFDKSSVTVKKAPSIQVINSINPFNWFNVARKLKKENADLIIFDWWHPFFAPCHFTISLLIKHKFKNKILFITENFISHEANRIDNFLTRIGLSNADHFLALSDVVAKDLKSISGKRNIFRSVLPNFDCYTDAGNFDRKVEREKLGYEEKDLVLLFFGYVRKYKGLDILIQSFKKIHDRNKNARLLIVGEFYQDPTNYHELVKETGKEECIKIINKFVPNEDVGKYYHASDLVVLPYRSATQSAVLNVAYSFLKPVIVTRVGGLAEFVINNMTGIIVEPDSPDAIVDGVDKFLSLRETTDFEGNIDKLNKSSEFEKLPELFDEIIRYSQEKN